MAKGGIRAGAGRKSKGDTRTMAFRLSKEVADVIERTANELGVTRTQVVETALKIASHEGIYHNL